MTIFSTMRRAGIPVLACLLALPALADEPGGLVTGSFGDQPLELTVAPELSGATIIGIVMRDLPKYQVNQSAFIDKLLTYDRRTRLTPCDFAWRVFFSVSSAFF